MKRCRFLSILLVTILITCLVAPQYVDAAVKLNKSKATMYVGDTLTLKISGTTKTVSWSTSKKAVATVSKKGVVTAKKEGTAAITAKVDNKKYTCKITVKEKFNKAEAVKNLSVKYHEVDNGVVAIIKNNYSYNLSLEATIVYYDENDKMMDKSSATCYCLPVGRTCAISLHGPYDSNYNDLDYSSYKVNFSCDYTDNIDLSKYIDYTYNDGADNVMIEISNTGKEEIDTVIVSIIFFKNGQAIGYDYTYADCNTPGTTSYVDFRYPYDENYDTVVPDDYEIYLNSAYSWNW